MNIEENFEKYGMAVPSFEALYDRLFLDEFDEQVHTRQGLIPASVEVKVVQCPFETLIQKDELDIPLCKNAENCNLEGNLDLCQVPHLHNFETPGPRMEFVHRTISDKFSLQVALARVARKTKTVRDMKKAGKKIVRPKELRRVLDTSVRPHVENTSTRMEVYSVYEYNTTPAAVPKTEIIRTREERWKTADLKEHMRLQIIQDSRDLKIDAMLATC